MADTGQTPALPDEIMDIARREAHRVRDLWRRELHADPDTADSMMARAAEDAVRAAAPLIVAAELDRLIVELDAEAERHGKRSAAHAMGTEDGLMRAGTHLQRRVDQLRGGAS